MSFQNRRDAGQRLARALVDRGDTDPVVLGITRGGVPVAFEVARALHAPLDVIVIRKLGVPLQPELAMGTVGEGGVLTMNDAIVQAAGVTRHDLLVIEAREREKVESQVRQFRANRARVPLQGRHVVIVDDGVATGATAEAACKAARALGASKVTLAVPVCARSAIEMLRHVADEVISLEQPSSFYSVGQWYADFTQTSDDEVMQLIESLAAALGGLGPDDGPVDRPSMTPIPPGFE